MSPLYSISKEFEFSASHQLDGLPEEHPCSRLHGHNYTVRLSITGTLDPVGFVVDYRALAPVKRWIDETLDHRHLNDVVFGNPTAENLAGHLTAVLPTLLPDLPHTVRYVQVGVSETGKTWANGPTSAVPHPDDRERGERYRWGIR